MASNGPIIVCPLRHERDRLRRRLGGDARFECPGPGGPAIEGWAARCGIEAGATVLLAGVAGGLSERARAGTAWAVKRVRLAGGEAGCTVIDDEARDANVSVVSVASPVASVDAKRGLREQSGADLVDLESAAFAAIACERRWNWGVVRGVSDGAESALPGDIERWVDGEGRARLTRVATSLLRRPTSIPSVVRLGRASNRALDAVAARVRALLEAE